jgi:hypothetical protein
MTALNVALLYFDAKAPSDVLDYIWDFGASPWLVGSDTIITASVTVSPTGLSIGVVTHDSTTVTGWLGGGVAATEYTVSANIVTAQGRTASRSAVLYVQTH